MKPNAEWIAQYHSRSDQFVPISEGRLVAKELGTEYFETEDDGHFQESEYPSFVDLVRRKIRE